jgi:glutathione synthase/RimK-type ligase-like ATP-grasp enzyme
MEAWMLTDPDGTSSLRRMVWVFPDRESSRGVPYYHWSFWDPHVEVAQELGMSWDRHAPEDIAVDAMDREPRVYVAGEPVTPADTLFVTSLYSLPYQSMEVFNQYAIYAVLERCGFYLPHPPYLSAVANDKLATQLHLKDSPIPTIPTIRIGTGRDLPFRHYEPALRQVRFPAIVKPVGWCTGWGICLARDLEDLRGLLSLAQGGDTPLAIQPYLGPDTVDLRVFMVDGQTHTVGQRTPAPGGYVSNMGRGGTAEYVPLPAELEDAVDYCAETVPIPYLCVDFLYDGQRYWLSEIEPDGATFPDDAMPSGQRRQRSIIEARYRAYQRGHARWLGGKPKEDSHA